MKKIGIGWLRALQFFSVIPVKKELPLEKDDVTSMYLLLPVLGGLFGGLAAAGAFLMLEFTGLSPLFIAFAITVFGIFLTGGLHLDGIADVGDAYFSYQDREKRLKIMGDPRIGAFGTMALLFAVLAKIVVIAELVEQVPLAALVLIPVLARVGLLLLFSLTESAKKEGLAAFFQNRADRKQITVGASVYVASLIVLFGFLTGWGLVLGLTAILLITLIAYRKWCLKNFGGVTGDLFGAYLEGTELLLWMALLFFI